MVFELISNDLEGCCERCGKVVVIANLTECLVCEGLTNVCGECLATHTKQHTAIELEEFRREMMDEPQLTIRERVNLELKEQIRRQAESLCDLIDRYETRLKQQEDQCRVLAEEVDRLRPAS